MREASVKRTTAETDIVLWLDLDGNGSHSEIHTGVGFLDHMLVLFSRHSGIEMKLSCKGDTWVDDHHSVEDVGIALGQAFDRALGDRRGIRRYGQRVLPMDEALILSAVDLSGRDFLGWDMSIPTEKVGTFDTELAEEFFLGFVRNAKCTLHVRQLSGSNSHHILEGTFKCVARALREAAELDPAFADEIPSTKGTL
jgi:imidazoleglycerol-phosphate dehydratase